MVEVEESKGNPGIQTSRWMGRPDVASNLGSARAALGFFWAAHIRNRQKLCPDSWVQAWDSGGFPSSNGYCGLQVSSHR